MSRPAAASALLALWVLGVGLLVAELPWLYDDRILLVNGHFAPLTDALRLAWTGDYWRLAAEGQQVLAGLYRPVTATSFAIEQAIVGVDPAVSHLVNLGLHVATAVAVGAWARQRGGVPWIAAGVVLLNPLAAELLGVATNRADLLAGLCVVGSLVARRAGQLGLAAVLVLLGALAKEVALVAPLLWIVDGARPGRAWLAALVPVGVVLGLRGVFVGLPPVAGANPLDALVSTGHTALHLLVPVPGGPLPAPWPAWVAAPVLLAGLLLARTHPFVPAWILVAWAPMAGWAGLPTRPADGTTYLPLLGFAVALAGAPGATRAGWSRTSALGLGAGALLTLQLAALHHHRDAGRFWAWATRANPGAVLGWSNLAASVAPTDGPRAAAAYDEAIRLARLSGEVDALARALTGRGWVALLAGDTTTARRSFQEAVARVGADRAPMAVKGLAALRKGGGG